jgi:hypothetical protein
VQIPGLLSSEECGYMVMDFLADTEVEMLPRKWTLVWGVLTD